MINDAALTDGETLTSGRQSHVRVDVRVDGLDGHVETDCVLLHVLLFLN